jgi:hypothetical protein
VNHAACARFISHQKPSLKRIVRAKNKNHFPPTFEALKSLAGRLVIHQGLLFGKDGNAAETTT